MHKKIENRELEKAFNDKKCFLPHFNLMLQPKALKNVLVQAKFEIYTMLKSLKLIGLVF